MARLPLWGQFEQYEAAGGLPSCYALCLSGELGDAFEKMREVGMMRQMDFHSHTSQYGSLTRRARFGDLDLESRMRAIPREIGMAPSLANGRPPVPRGRRCWRG